MACIRVGRMTVMTKGAVRAAPLPPWEPTHHRSRRLPALSGGWLAGMGLGGVLLWGLSAAVPPALAEATPTHLQRAKIYLAATDYRRAIQACERELEDRPSAASYVYLTYVYQALSAYLDHLAKTDRWVVVEQVFINLASEGIRDLVDPPSVLPRMAKEMLHESLRQQSDVTAAMATRLDQPLVNRLWQQQAAWRKAQPDAWWAGVPEAWNW